jgi:hypothetical protein
MQLIKDLRKTHISCGEMAFQNKILKHFPLFLIFILQVLYQKKIWKTNLNDLTSFSSNTLLAWFWIWFKSEKQAWACSTLPRAKLFISTSTTSVPLPALSCALSHEPEHLLVSDMATMPSWSPPYLTRGPTRSKPSQPARAAYRTLIVLTFALPRQQSPVGFVQDTTHTCIWWRRRLTRAHKHKNTQRLFSQHRTCAFLFSCPRYTQTNWLQEVFKGKKRRHGQATTSWSVYHAPLHTHTLWVATKLADGGVSPQRASVLLAPHCICSLTWLCYSTCRSLIL